MSEQAQVIIGIFSTFGFYAVAAVILYVQGRRYKLPVSVQSLVNVASGFCFGYAFIVAGVSYAAVVDNELWFTQFSNAHTVWLWGCGSIILGKVVFMIAEYGERRDIVILRPLCKAVKALKRVGRGFGSTAN